MFAGVDCDLDCGEVHSGFRVEGLEFAGVDCGIVHSGFRVEGLGFRVCGRRLRCSAFRPALHKRSLRAHLDSLTQGEPVLRCKAFTLRVSQIEFTQGVSRLGFGVGEFVVEERGLLVSAT